MSSKGGSPFLDLQRNKSLRVKWNINASGITRGRYSAGMRRSLSERASSKLCKSSRATCKDFGFCNKLSLSQISTIDHKQVRTRRLGRQILQSGSTAVALRMTAGDNLLKVVRIASFVSKTDLHTERRIQSSTSEHRVQSSEFQIRLATATIYFPKEATA